MNIVVGDTSQLAYFFPDNFIKISSRNINIGNQNFDTVYLTFAEQRTFNKNLSESDFIEINVNYTTKVINELLDKSKKIIIYGTAELWNNHDGAIDINSKIDYKYSFYVKSKELLYEKLLENRQKSLWHNVFIIHPFNFNSLKRKEGFLFHKIYDSLINNKINNVGYLDINRDIIHTSFLAKQSLICNEDCLVGSGKLTNIKNFITNLFGKFNKHYEDFLIEDKNAFSFHKGNEFYLKSNIIYNNLLNDTIYEINQLHEAYKIS